MKFQHLFAVLACLLLLPATSQAWWAGPGGGHYGGGPFNSAMDGNFSFNSSMRGHGSAAGQQHYRGYQGYPRYMPNRQAGFSPWVIRGVNFKYDSAELTPPSMEILDAVANTVKNRPPQRLEVGGHASAEGDTPYNLALSERRAETVRAYLVARGVRPDLLSWRGYGESRPLAHNTTEAGRILNRRVELMPLMNRYR